MGWPDGVATETSVSALPADQIWVYALWNVSQCYALKALIRIGALIIRKGFC